MTGPLAASRPASTGPTATTGLPATTRLAGPPPLAGPGPAGPAPAQPPLAESAPAESPPAESPPAQPPPAQPAPAGPPPDALARRARRLLRWYPASWRARYGAEFTELLIADLAELPHHWQRDADVARGGLRARLAAAGLAGCPAGPAGAGAALATLAATAAGFLTLGATLWAQITVGWQWAPPATRTTRVAMVVMSAVMLLFAVLAVLAVAGVGWTAVQAIRQGRGRPLRWPAVLVTGGAAILIVGGRHFGNGWPGTGGHWWPGQHLVPGGVAAFAWACTLPVTSYWAHPGMLASFPPAELAWLLVSPAAMACVIAGAVRLVRRLPLPPGVVRYEAWLGGIAGAGMAAFLAAALCWVVSGGSGPHGLFRAGLIDGGALALMAVALAAGWLALRQVLRAGHTFRAAGPERR